MGGDALTSIILNISPHIFNSSETISTLEFGDKVNRVRCKPIIHQDVSVDSLNSAIRIARLTKAKALAEMEITTKRISLRRTKIMKVADNFPASVFGYAIEAHPEQFLLGGCNLLRPHQVTIHANCSGTRLIKSHSTSLRSEASTDASCRPRRATALSRYFLVQVRRILYQCCHTFTIHEIQLFCR